MTMSGRADDRLAPTRATSRTPTQERKGSVSVDDQLEIARQSYLAFARGDRSFFEAHLGERFEFSSPPDPHLDRGGWFERCWPGAGQDQRFEFVRLVEAGDEVIVTYELRRPDGTGGRNTEVLTFAGDKIVRTEVYFGWDLG
jgi:ketosteroid isomerase-like protein